MGQIIITTVVVSVLCALFALLLSFADKYIADYGEVKLTINNDKEFTVDGGDSLLSTLRNQKFSFHQLVVERDHVVIVK